MISNKRSCWKLGIQFQYIHSVNYVHTLIGPSVSSGYTIAARVPWLGFIKFLLELELHLAHIGIMYIVVWPLILIWAPCSGDVAHPFTWQFAGHCRLVLLIQNCFQLVLAEHFAEPGELVIQSVLFNSTYWSILTEIWKKYR